MTEIAVPPPASLETAATPPARRTRMLHALSSDWGLRILALVLAVLLWSVVRQDISVRREVFVDVVPRPVSPRIEAYLIPREKVKITLEGPQGEIDEARDKLAQRPYIEVRVDDLDPGVDKEEVPLRWSQEDPRWVLGPLRRNVVDIPPILLKVYRKVQQPVHVTDPGWGNLPKGYGYEARDLQFKPSEVVLDAAVDALGEVLAPDAVEVGPSFADRSALEGPVTYTLSFNRWRKGFGDAEKAMLRENLVIPPVTVTVHFFLVSTRKITTEIAWSYAGTQGDSLGDYDKVIEQTVDGLDKDQMRFEGQFRGAEADLQYLAEHREEWNFAIVLPLAEMVEFHASPDVRRSVSATLDWRRSGAAAALAVEFVPPPNFSKLSVTVTKRAP